MKRRASCTIEVRDEGLPLLSLLTRRFDYHSETEWVEMVEARRLLLNGVPAAVDTVLTAGDSLEFRVPERPEPLVCTDFSIIHEDGALLVVDKPASLPCHPAGRFFNHTLWALLRSQRPSEALQFVNRLDRETSGIVLLAKTAEAAKACRAAFGGADVTKTYLVLVEGEFPDALHAEGHLGADEDSVVRKKRRFVLCCDVPGVEPVRGPAWASTVFRCLQRVRSLSLLEARLGTGRTHQIRATLCSLGFPVVGDKLYGVDETAFLRFIADALTDEDREKLRLPRQALHASDLQLPHPTSGEPMRFHSPVPADMARLVGA